MTAIPLSQPLRLLHRPLVHVQTGALVMLVAGAVPQPARVLLAVPALLLLPGYATLILLRRNGRSDSTQTLLLSLVVSMAVIPLLLLGLHGAGMPLVSGAMIPAVAAYCCVAALLGGRRAIAPQALDAGVVAVGARVAIAAIAAAAVIGVGLRVLPGAPDPGYTSLALGGSWATVSEPTFVPPGKPASVTVGVTNHGDAPKRYVIRPSMAGGAWKPRTITVAAGATWTGDVTGTVPRGGCLHRLLIALDSRREDRIDGLTVWFQSSRTLPQACDAVGRAG